MGLIYLHHCSIEAILNLSWSYVLSTLSLPCLPVFDLLMLLAGHGLIDRFINCSVCSDVNRNVLMLLRLADAAINMASFHLFQPNVIPIYVM